MENLTPAVATVVASIITGIVAIVVCVLNNRAQRLKFSEEIKKRDAERDKAEAVRDAKLEMWMKSVNQKLDQHNGYAERFGGADAEPVEHPAADVSICTAARDDGAGNAAAGRQRTRLAGGRKCCYAESVADRRQEKIRSL